MDLPDWLLPPRHALVLFAGVTLLPAAVLLVLGWNLLQQDRVVARQQAADELELRANRVTASLQQELDALDRRLPVLLTTPSPGLGTRGAVAVRLTAGGVEAHTGDPLVYVPMTITADDPPDRIWQVGEALELQHDLPGATRAFLTLTTSSDPAIRGGAWLRLARVLRGNGKLDRALDAYRSLAAIPTFSLRGDPSDLRARRALCALLAELGRKDELLRETASLSQDLARGRWRIDRTTYTYYRDELRPWTAARDDEGDTEALAGAIDSMWREWQATPRPVTGRRSAWLEGRPLLLVWNGDGSSLIAFAATAQFIDNAWHQIWLDQHASAHFSDIEGHTVLGTPVASGVPAVVRMSPDTRLPWTLRVTSADPPDGAAAIADHRRLVLATLTLVVVLFLERAIPSCGPSSGSSRWRACRRTSSLRSRTSSERR